MFDLTTSSNSSSINPYNYYALRDAWASVMADMLQAYEWQWWITLTSRDPMPLHVLRGRFFWWLKCVRKKMGYHLENIWIIERQRRGALHVHAVISGVRTDERFWRWAVRLWETYHSKPGDVEKFGSATIKPYNPGKAGDLADYLAKERSKDLGELEGSGSIFEKFGFSRGVRKYYDAGVSIECPADFMNLVVRGGRSIELTKLGAGEPTSAELKRSCEYTGGIRNGSTRTTLSTIQQ